MEIPVLSGNLSVGGRRTGLALDVAAATAELWPGRTGRLADVAQVVASLPTCEYIIQDRRVPGDGLNSLGRCGAAFPAFRLDRMDGYTCQISG